MFMERQAFFMQLEALVYGKERIVYEWERTYYYAHREATQVWCKEEPES